VLLVIENELFAIEKSPVDILERLLSVSIANVLMSLSVSHSITVFTMNGTNRNSSPSVSTAGTNNTARMNHPRKKFSSEKTTATRIAAPTLLTLTDGRKRASRRTVAVNTTRCSTRWVMNMRLA